MFKKIQRIHFIGIGGSGMSGIAEVLLTLGYKVSGSDLKETDVTRRLAGLGARVFIGHKADQVADAHVTVTSTAVGPDNPELREALSRKIPVIPRIEMLAELARLKYTIAVAGTHGKTTTTSLVSLILQAGGLDPTVIIGGRLHNLGTGARVGCGEYLVAEADESDGSFLKLTPALAVVTNIDNDHLDYWRRMQSLYAGFEQFANKVPFYGAVILCADDPGARKILPRVRRPLVTYGLSAEADVRAVDIQAAPGKTTYVIQRGREPLGRMEWSVPGRHNVVNSLAAAAVGLELGVPFKTIAEAMSSFKGVGRRLELKGEAGGVTVVDDYGHHPTEIRATLQAVKERWPGRRCLVLFQPHRYTRTKLLADHFAESFAAADALFLMDIYPAGEPPLEGVDSAWLAGRFAAKKLQASAPPKDEVLPALLQAVRPGDVVVTVGAGDVWKMGEELVKKLSNGR
ncbi:MAG: UDP-N-acetylmuramate--L-alanine ligase [Elusimicrobiota bacterium]